MRHFALIVVVPAIAWGQSDVGNASDALCKPLKAFVASVGPGIIQELVFYTSWGSGFKGDKEDSIYAKRCAHGGYAPAKAVCDYLMASGEIEFSGNNVKRAVSCLSRDTRFSRDLRLDRGDFQFTYGTDNRGQIVKISFSEDSGLGAMALRITAHGY
jgi:hypothetical protein